MTTIVYNRYAIPKYWNKNKCKIVILTLFFYDLYKKYIIENIKYSFVFMYMRDKGSF